MIAITNLTKKYGKLTAVDNLSLTTGDSGVFALLGLNGAGKTTTINILCSLLTKTSGTVTVNGLDLDKDQREIKRMIGVSPQETAVAPNLTVKENLELVATLYDVPIAPYVDDVLKDFSLEEKKDARAKTLSGGQKRRLSLAMAVITQPKILILDEPTLGLDVKARRDLWKTIDELKKDRLIILTTHYLEEAVALSDCIAIMNKGKLIAQGTAQSITESCNAKTFEDAFLQLTEE